MPKTLGAGLVTLANIVIAGVAAFGGAHLATSLREVLAGVAALVGALYVHETHATRRAELAAISAVRHVATDVLHVAAPTTSSTTTQTFQAH